MNGNKTLTELREEACPFGIASRAVQDERDANTDKRIIEMREWIFSETAELKNMIRDQTGNINKLWIAQLPNALTLLGIIITIIVILKK